MKITVVEANRFLRSKFLVHLERYDRIDEEAAAVLARSQDNLSLSGLTELGVNEAKAFSGHKGRLNLSGLSELDDDAAYFLSRHKGEIMVRSLVVLEDTKGHMALAGKLATQDGTLNLPHLLRLGSGCAMKLSKHRGKLNLSGLTGIDGSAAFELSKHEGEVDLSGLKSMGESEGHLKLIDKAVKGGWDFDFSIVTELSDGTADRLSHMEKPPRPVSLRRLQDGEGHLRYLKKILETYSDLEFESIESIGSSAAQLLIEKDYFRFKSSGYGGVIYDVILLSANQLRLLSLIGMREMSLDLLTGFKDHKNILNLSAFDEISVECARVLGGTNAKSILLAGLRTLPLPIAKSLSQFKGQINLQGLKQLSLPMARVISDYEAAILNLSGITSISVPVARELAKFKGELILNGIKRLDRDAALCLMDHENYLCLDGLTHMEEHEARVIKHFQSNDDEIRFINLVHLTHEAARILVDTIPYLIFPKLRRLDVETATIFGQGDAFFILEGLESISEEVAEALAEYGGEQLCFSVKRPLSEDSIRALYKFQGLTIKIPGLSVMDGLTAELLFYHGHCFPITAKLTKAAEFVLHQAASSMDEIYKEPDLSDLTDSEAMELSKLGDGCFSGVEYLRHLGDSKGFLALTRSVLNQDDYPDLSRLESVGPKAARIIADRFGDDELNLSGLKSIDLNVAKSLSHHSGFKLILSGLRTLSSSSAKALAMHKGLILILTGLKTLHPEIANALSDYEGDLDLSDVGNIDFPTAQALSRHRGELDLSGLRCISPEIAELFSSREGGLILDGIHYLTDEAAHHLASMSGPLYLDSIKVINDSPGHLKLAEKLSTVGQSIYWQFEFQYVGKRSESLFKKSRVKYSVSRPQVDQQLVENLSSYKRMYEALLAGTIASNNTDPKSPENITLLDDTEKHLSFAKEVANTKEPIHFPRLRYISKESAACFSQHRAMLNLNGLLLLDSGTAEELSKHKSPIDLSRISSLDEDSALALSRHQGEIKLTSLRRLPDMPGHIALSRKLAGFKGPVDLSGLTMIGHDSARELSLHKGPLVLSGLIALTDSEGHVLLARKLSNQHGMLDFPRLETVGIQAIMELSKFKGQLSLPAMREMNDCIADSLSKHDGLLDLSGVEIVSDISAKSLSRHRGRIIMRKLRNLDDLNGHVALAEKLASHKGDLDLSGIVSLAEIPAAALSSHKGVLDLRGIQQADRPVLEALAPHEGPILFSHELTNSCNIVQELIRNHASS